MAKPIKTVKIGNFSASVFMNEIEKNDQKFEVPSVNFQKSYVKKDGDPKNKDDWVNVDMSLMNAGEIDRAIMVLTDVKRALYTKDFE